MSDERLSPLDPQEWLNRARSNLSQAKGGLHLPDVYLEDLCFQAQQAAEKALKGVLLAFGIHFPYTHDLASLLSLVERANQPFPDEVRQAAQLTDYGVEARYPAFSEPVTQEEYEEAVSTASAVLNWAERLILMRSASSEDTPN